MSINQLHGSVLFVKDIPMVCSVGGGGWWGILFKDRHCILKISKTRLWRQLLEEWRSERKGVIGSKLRQQGSPRQFWAIRKSSQKVHLRLSTRWIQSPRYFGKSRQLLMKTSRPFRKIQTCTLGHTTTTTRQSSVSRSATQLRNQTSKVYSLLG